jgi:hypothetical protein
MPARKSVTPAAAALVIQVERHILLLRKQRILLSHDLAVLYGVETKALNRAVKRNIDRFPGDFMFQLTSREWADLKCQIGTASWGGSRVHPYACCRDNLGLFPKSSPC